MRWKDYLRYRQYNDCMPCVQNLRCTRLEFAPFYAPFAGKNMLILANICKNTDLQTGKKTYKSRKNEENSL